MLNYVPLRRNKSFNSGSQLKVSSSEQKEGLYDEAEGRGTDFVQRKRNIEEIKQFLECTFQEKPQMSLEDFVNFNTDISSEMFVSIMAIFHERLPCSRFYFRQRRRFKQRFFSQLSNSDQRRAESPHLTHEEYESRGSSEYYKTKSPAVNYSPVRAIAQPRIITGWSPKTSQKSSDAGYYTCNGEANKFAQMQPEFRIRKGVNIGQARQSSLKKQPNTP